MYGGIMCYSKDAANGVLSEYYRTAKSKPQVMSDAFSKEYFLGLINDESAQKKSAKAFLRQNRLFRDWETVYYRTFCIMPTSIRRKK